MTLSFRLRKYENLQGNGTLGVSALRQSGSLFMFPEKEWAAVRNEAAGTGASAGAGILRLTLLFGSAAVALALIAAPVASRYSGSGSWQSVAGLDAMTTGSAGYEGTYILRRSVLQASPASICVIRDNGSRAGSC
jgi:hypothetical protein